MDTLEQNKNNSYIPDSNEMELFERVVKMARVAKVVKGGRRFSFNALTVVGDMKSYVGLGFGKAKEIPEAIRKSIENGKKNLIKVKKQDTTIPHKVIGKYKSAKVLLRPSTPGTGIIAGEAVRAIVELGGIQDILTKRFGSSNKLNIVKATLDALDQLSTPQEAKERRGISLSNLFGPYSKARRDQKLSEAKILSKEDSLEEKVDSEETKKTEETSTSITAPDEPKKEEEAKIDASSNTEKEESVSDPKEAETDTVNEEPNEKN